MKKIFLIISVLVPFAAGVPWSARAQNVNLSSYNISPKGNYNYIRLMPKNDATRAFGQPCSNQAGTFYFDQNSDTVLLCQGSPGAETWGSLSDVWMQTIAFGSTLVSPSDEANAANINVGIGTTTPEFKLTLQGDGSILARGQKGGGATLAQMQWANFLWYPRKAAIWAGSFSQTVADANIGLYSVNFGYSMQTPNQGSTAYGGCSGANCTDLGQGATIGGGFNNSAAGTSATIAGGRNSTASAQGTFVGGALGNATGPFAAILSADKDTNDSAGQYAFQGGGSSSMASGTYSVIGGGTDHQALGEAGVVGGGLNNQIVTGTFRGVIAGGSTNRIQGNQGFIGGGNNNVILACSVAAIMGGKNNCLGGTRSGGSSKPCDTPVSSCGTGAQFIGGGESNTVNNTYATVFSGKNNLAWHQNGFIGGGEDNSAYGYSPVIGGGKANKTGSSYDGSCPFVGGGNHNEAIADYSVVPGGLYNVIDRILVSGNGTASYSMAGGKNMKIASVSSSDPKATFLWGIDTNSSNTDVSANGPNFIVFPYSEGKVGIGTKAPGALLHIIDGNMKISPKVPGNTASVRIDNPETLPLDPLYLVWEENNNGRVAHKDIAEIFSSVEAISAGDVLIFDPQKPGQVKKSRRPYDPMLVGVASVAPASTFEGDQIVISPPSFSKGKNPPVALAGRVLVKVSLENGSIVPGDLLTSSSKAGYAMKATDLNKARHAVIGKALEAFNGGPKGKKTGLIETVIMTK